MMVSSLLCRKLRMRDIRLIPRNSIYAPNITVGLGMTKSSTSPEGDTVSDRRGILPKADTAESAVRLKRKRHEIPFGNQIS